MDGLTAEAHADRLAAIERSWSTIEVTSTHRLESTRDPTELRPKSIDAIRSHYIEAKGTGRYLREETTLGQEFEGASIHTFDGTMGLDILVEFEGPTQARLVSSFYDEARTGRNDRPSPLDRLWVGRVPLAEALATAEPLGPADVRGWACDVFLIKEVVRHRGRPAVYTLDRATSLPVRVRLYRDEASRAADRPIVAWEATEIAREGDYPYVRHAVQVDSTRPDGSRSMDREFDVESIRLDGPVSPSIFAPTLPVGARFVDDRTPVTSGYQTYLTAPATAPAVPFPSTPATIAPPPASPDRPTVGLGASVALVLALGAVLIWARLRAR